MTTAVLEFTRLFPLRFMPPMKTNRSGSGETAPEGWSCFFGFFVIAVTLWAFMMARQDMTVVINNPVPSGIGP